MVPYVYGGWNEPFGICECELDRKIEAAVKKTLASTVEKCVKKVLAERPVVGIQIGCEKPIGMGIQAPRRVEKPCGCRSYEELRRIESQREPDGIDVHVDRPRRENFCSHFGWADAMAKYRTLEDAAKACTWPAREPMKGAPRNDYRW